MKKLCCCIKVCKWFDKWLASASKSKHSIEKPSLTQSDVFSNTQSASSTKRFMSVYSHVTLHSFMNKKTREDIIAKFLL